MTKNQIEIGSIEMAITGLALSHFTDQDRVHLILVLVELKRVCNIEIVNPDKEAYVKGFEENYQKNTVDFEAGINCLQHALKQLNLPFRLARGHVDRDHDSPGYSFASFDISKEQNFLDALVEIDNESDEKIKYERLGNIFDIPETAIRAWTKGNIKDTDALPGYIKKSEYYNFIDFVLSEDHWEEELEITAKRAGVIKQIAPQLYKDIISNKTT